MTRPDTRPVYPAGTGLQPGGDINSHNRLAALVNHLDHTACALQHFAMKSGPINGVNNKIRFHQGQLDNVNPIALVHRKNLLPHFPPYIKVNSRIPANFTHIDY
ncbi:MAG: hypothetical protein BWY65_01459 [Firmicutes bacterium ADurb.Bin373]|nr:MAG: hypothetical protein BWY65_01459 [Firmicutes bacterium ADurb.Bin373]